MMAISSVLTLAALVSLARGIDLSCVKGVSADMSTKVVAAFGASTSLKSSAVTIGDGQGPYIYEFSPCALLSDGNNLIALDAADGKTCKKSLGVTTNATVAEKNGVLTLSYVHSECHSSVILACGTTKGAQFERVDAPLGACKESGVFVVTSAELCPKSKSTASVTTTGVSGTGGHTFLGTVLFLLFVGVFLYLLGGFAYNRFVLGATDYEQCPNFHFWMNSYRAIRDVCGSHLSGGFPRTTSGIGDYAPQPVPNNAPGAPAGRFQYDQPTLAAAPGQSPSRRTTRTEEESADEMLLPV